MDTMRAALGLVLLAQVVLVTCKLPDYIPVCKRNDPNVNSCIKDAVDKMLPVLRKGIPELDVPPLEPFVLKRLELNAAGFQAIGNNVLVYGPGFFELMYIKADVNNSLYELSVKFPKIRINAIYQISGRVVVPIQGRGPVDINATNVVWSGKMFGKLVPRNGKQYLTFDKFNGTYTVPEAKLHLEGLFDGNKLLTDATNTVLNENWMEVIDTALPSITDALQDALLNIANKVCKNFSFDELYPID